jgi:hypothetical protein
MIIGDFNKKGVSVAPDKADAPLVINSNAVLPGAVAFQSFKAVSGWNAQVLKTDGVVREFQFPHGRPLNLNRQPGNIDAMKKAFRPVVFETHNHTFSMTRKADNSNKNFRGM